MVNHKAYISIGSNIGDKCGNCLKGIALLRGSGTATLKKQSRFYRTEPVGYKDQDWFINAVVCIGTTMDPHGLFQQLKDIEATVGRKAEAIRFGPRILDLDILFYDDGIVDTPDLVIPHPRLHKRRFVLQPFCDIDPNKVHPVLKMDMQDLLGKLNDHDEKVVLYPCEP